MASRCISVLLVLTAFLCIRLTAAQSDRLTVGAFNVQIFGVTKSGNTEVVATLSKIVRRYDVILIQEIRDVSETIIHDFLDIVNQDSLSDGVQYAMNISERLGRTNSKEQYAFMYRVDKVRVVQISQYEDRMFERPPYSVLLQALTIALPPFFLTASHVQPSAAFDEINSLLVVYKQLTQQFQTTLGVLLGDLNADCSFLSQTNYNMLDLVTDKRFHWLIGSEVDTTTNDNDCSYDRIIVFEDLLSYVVNGSAGVFRFDEQYSLTMEQTLNVSDHYPVHFSMQALDPCVDQPCTDNTTCVRDSPLNSQYTCMCPPPLITDGLNCSLRTTEVTTSDITMTTVQMTNSSAVVVMPRMYGLLLWLVSLMNY